MSDRRLILASASPRRRELLTAIGLIYEVIPSTVDEDALLALHPKIAPDAMVRLLADAKATDVASRQTGNAIVIGADTVVVLDDDVLQKPRDAAEAREMLSRLSGRTHQVYTGIALVSVDNGAALPAQLDHVVTDVTFSVLTNDVIDTYVATGEPMDKAGAYGIQERGSVLIEQINGDYFNVVGLPVNRLARLLEKHGVSIWQPWRQERTMTSTDGNGNPERQILDVDGSKYPEVLAALGKLDADAKSIQPTLAARALAVGEFAGTGICIGIGEDERQLMGELDSLSIVSVRAVVTASCFEEASLIRLDMERYFARHFPGRCLKNQISPFGAAGSIVYVIFFTPP